MIYLAYIMIALIIFTFGIVIGSFLNVVIYRLPKRENIALGRSHCMTCGETIRKRDLVPIFSFLALKGKCHSCKSEISPRYMCVEFFTGIICVLTFFIKGFNSEALIIFLFSTILISITLIDWDTLTIPNPLVIATLILAIPSYFVMPEITILERIIGFFVVSVPLLITAIVVSGAFGGGDIKLIAACGLILGYKLTVLAIFIAFLTGGLFAIFLVATKRTERGKHMPFGPFICSGCYISVMWGTQIISWYLSQF